MRCDLKLDDFSRMCACGMGNLINYSLTWKLGRYISMRHNIVRETIADNLDEVGKDVVDLEATLKQVEGGELSD